MQKPPTYTFAPRAPAKYRDFMNTVHDVCVLRNLGDGYNDRDPQGRSTETILETLRRVSPWFPDRLVIKELDSSFPRPPPECDHDAVYAALEYLLSGQRWTKSWKQRGGVYHTNWQVTLSSDLRCDGGAWDHLQAWLSETYRLIRSGRDVPTYEKKYCETLYYKRRFIQKVIEALAAKNQKATQIHDVFYGVRGKTSCHRDQRLTSPAAWRIIFCAPSPPGCPPTPKRLTFYLAQEAPPSKNWSRGFFTPHGAYCLGEMKTDVFMTGRGAGGVEVIPAGVVDLSGKWKDFPSSKWPPVYIFHEPFTKGGAEQKAGSYVFSGKTAS